MDLELIQIKDIYSGQILREIRALVCQYPDQPDHSEVEGILLSFDEMSIVIQSVNDTSELMVHTGEFKPNCEPEDLQFYSEVDLSEKKIFIAFIGQPLEYWWSAQNERGCTDGFFVTFKKCEGLFFIAMNNNVVVKSLISKNIWP